MKADPSKHFVNFSYRFASREPGYDVYPQKSRHEGGLPWEGFEKAAWLHHCTGVPVTWIVDSVALEQAGRRLRRYTELYGDEIILSLESFGRQPLFEKLGVVQKPFGLRNYSFGELCTIFEGYRRLASETLGGEITIGGGYWYNADVIRAARETGFEALWGLCWDQKGIDGATHRGSPWFPYYASENEFKAPAVSRENGILILPWYRADLGNAFLFSEHPPFTTHTGELARWCLDYPAEYFDAMLRQALAETAHSPFSYSEIHLECDWMDSSGIYNDEELSPATEVWAFQKACVSRGIDPSVGTVSGMHDFVAWHLKNHPGTTRHQLDWTDPFGNFPNLRFTADASAIQVAAMDGKVLARQEYRDGRHAAADEGFLNRRKLQQSLCPNPKLPPALLRRIAIFEGSYDTNPNVTPET